VDSQVIDLYCDFEISMQEIDVRNCMPDAMFCHELQTQMRYNNVASIA
jgi:hypothetical protein